MAVGLVVYFLLLSRALIIYLIECPSIVCEAHPKLVNFLT
jgi:hypothetical protein